MDAVPHPLVAELVQQLLKRRVKGYSEDEKQALAIKLVDTSSTGVPAEAAADEQARELREQQVTALTDAMNEILDKPPGDLDDDERRRLVAAAEGVDFPDLVALAGYLGGTVDERPPGRQGRWRILYLDSRLQNWRLIPEEDILVFNRMYVEDAAFGARDVIWVDRDALTATGGAPPRPEEQARYLRGNFTKAGDLVSPGGQGAPEPDPQTGVFCPITPRCCTRPVRP
jgi:hypothetical protein